MTNSDIDRQFLLLQHELTSIDEGIRAYDSLVLQVKGWSVTVAVAISGVAIAREEWALAVLGVAATAVFLFIDGHQKSVQRQFIEKRKSVERIIHAHPNLQDALNELNPPFIQRTFGSPVEKHRPARPDLPTPLLSGWAEAALHLRETLSEMRRPLTYFTYVAVALCQGLLALLLARA